MAVYTPGPIVHKISGKVGNTVFAKWRGIPVVRQAPISMTNPQTPAQQAVRGLLSDLGKAWASMTAAEQAAFDHFGTKAFGISDTLKKVDPGTLLSVPRGPMTGWNAFVQVNMNRILSGCAGAGDFLTEAPINKPKPPNVANIDLNQVGDNIVISGELTSPPETDDIIQIWLKSLDVGIHTQLNRIIVATTPFEATISQGRGALGVSIPITSGNYQFQVQVVNKEGLVSVPSYRMAILVDTTNLWHFVSRPCSAADKLIGDFTADGAWHNDGLDLSGIIPTGAKWVLFFILGRSTGVNKRGIIRPNSTTRDGNRLKITSQYANVLANPLQAMLPCEADRLFDYNLDATFDLFTLAVLGWWI